MKVAYTRPPAKLNLFLELLSKRSDGYHEIDTVMVPIDLCDELRLSRTSQSAIRLDVDWIETTEVVASRLGIQPGSPQSDALLTIPNDESNLVHRALRLFIDRFNIDGAFDVQLRKRIPAGAGMGGASSDAASALLSAAKLCGISPDSDDLAEIAASIGSDVPFFFGDRGRPIQAARARGRGEKIESISMPKPLHFVVVFPAASLSTPTVYGNSNVPRQPRSADTIVEALESGDVVATQKAISNRLAQSAKEILPRIDEILETMWRSGLPACQLTGSGSACFAIVQSVSESQQCTRRLRCELEPGALVTPACSVILPAGIKVDERE